MLEPLADDLVTVNIGSSEVVFSGRVWNVKRETFVLDGVEIVREFMDHPGAVAVLALDDDDRVLLIKQYRHPVRVRDWELPAGLLDAPHESPLEAARRELAEEADLVAESWHLLAEFMLSPGGSNETVRIYLARGITAAPEAFARTEEEAGIELRWVPLDDAVDAVVSRSLQNSILAMAVLSAHAARAGGWESLASADSPWSRHPSFR